MSPSSGYSSHNEHSANQEDDASTEALTPFQQQILHLKRQIDIESKVKQGADNMIDQYSKEKDKKLLNEAMQMSADSKAKIEYLRMRLLKVFTDDVIHTRTDSTYFGTVKVKI